MHCGYLKSGGFTKNFHAVNKVAERDLYAIDIDKHYHCKILFQHALGNINDVYSVCGTFFSHTGDYTDAVASGNGNYSFHFVLSFGFYLFIIYSNVRIVKIICVSVAEIQRI